MTTESKNEYQSFAEKIQQELSTDISWVDQYDSYVDILLENEKRINEMRVCFHEQKPLYVYLSIGRVAKAKLMFNLRFLGQSIGDLMVDGSTVMLNIDETQAKNNRNYFSKKEFKQCMHFTKAGSYPWKGDEATKIRKEFAERLIDTDCVPRQQEHMVESALFSEFEKDRGEKKSLRWIQPIDYAGVRIHMKTALKASSVVKGDAALSSAGGEIDLFCRRKVGNRSYLTVIEIKDENKAGESPEKAIKQALAYAVFIRELIRSKCGAKWMQIWGTGNQPWQDSVVLNAVIAMPESEHDNLSFVGQEITLGNDIIKLHHISFVGDRKPRDGEDIKIKTSL